MVKKYIAEMLRVYENKPEKVLPIYDHMGNLHWPIEMTNDEIKKFVAERDRRKEENKSPPTPPKGGEEN